MANQIARLSRKDFVSAALAAGGENASFTPVQVQKLFFLIDREGASFLGGPYFSFVPYDYGPFDRRVYEELDSLATTGSVQIDTSAHYRRYSLTQEGYVAGQRALSQISENMQAFLREAATWVQKLSFQQLVAAIYRKYPDMKVHSVFQQ